MGTVVANPFDRLQGIHQGRLRKMIARLHEELAMYEGSEEARQLDSN